MEIEIAQSDPAPTSNARSASFRSVAPGRGPTSEVGGRLQAIRRHRAGFSTDKSGVRLKWYRWQV